MNQLSKAPIRIELMHNGFADRSLTAWVWCHNATNYNKNQNVCLESRKTTVFLIMTMIERL